MTTSLPSRWAARSPRLSRWLGMRLTRQGRLEEADAVLAAALAAFPDHRRLVVPYAFVAHQAARHAEALERWTRAAAIRPDNPMSWCGVSANARALGLTDCAQQAIAEGLERFPGHGLLVTEAAFIADSLGRYAEGLACWQTMVEQKSTHAECWVGYVHDLVRLGRLADAASAQASAQTRHPGHPTLLISEAILAIARGDLVAAMSAIRDFTRRFPDDASGRNLLGHILMERGLAIVDGLVEEAIADVDRVEDDAVRALLLGFESLGADCELGLVQRRFGAEPLGLLRWSDVRLPGLQQALAAHFADMGADETTLMTIDLANAYYVCDARWGLGMHTFVSAAEADSVVLLPKMRRRVAYLRDKLLADLAAAEKVFVWKSDEIDLAGLRSLHDRLASYGPVRLLNVRSTPLPGWGGPHGEAGSTVRVAPDLHVGTLSRLGNAGRVWDIAFDEWIALCRAVATELGRSNVGCCRLAPAKESRARTNT